MELSLPDEKNESKEEKPQPYISKVGFVTVPVLRGFTEIAFLFSIAHTESSFICGGYARYCASPNKKPTLASDVDIYCKDKETFERLKGGHLKNYLFVMKMMFLLLITNQRSDPIPIIHQFN